MAEWNAESYLRFEDERTRPARDLLAQVPLEDARRIVDLGCGPGNSTELIVARYPHAEIVGLDSSRTMLEAARKRLPAVEFVQADLEAWRPAPGTDLLFANAVFQWLPGQMQILHRLLDALPAGGVLAVQMPDNLDEPSHVAMREAAAAGPWAAKLGEAVAARAVLPAPSAYYDLLKPLCRRLDIWHTVYNHPLAGADAVVDWVKATGLRPFTDPLEAEERAAFLADYTARVARAYPPLHDDRVLLRFPRLFIVAVR